MLRIVSFVLALSVVSTPALAKKEIFKEIPSDAIMCAALHYIVGPFIRSQPLTEKQKRTNIKKQRVFELLFGAHYGRDNQITVTKGLVSAQKSFFAKKIGELYDANPELVYEIEIRCYEWYSDIAKAIRAARARQKPSSDLSNNEILRIGFLSVGKLPVIKASAHPRWKMTKAWMDASMVTWNALDRMTPSKGKAKVLEELKKRGINPK